MARLHNDAVAVVGLGRFGLALAQELMATGTEVLGIDTDEQIIQRVAGSLTHAVIADATDEAALRQLGVHEFQRVVVGISDHIEASILACSNLVSFGVPDIWGKAVSEQHARILVQVGCHHVIRPEYDTGRRVAHLIAGRLIDYIEFDDGYAIVKMRPPREILGQTLAACRLRQGWGVTIVGVKRAGQDFTHAVPDTVVEDGDLIIVSGDRRKVEGFAELLSK
ncbi:MAG: TrkA family potassium uptake protein [Nocardioides sp.]